MALIPIDQLWWMSTSNLWFNVLGVYVIDFRALLFGSSVNVWCHSSSSLCLYWFFLIPFICFSLALFSISIKVFLLGRILGAAVVIAANAGGSWTPIGDVTTTMLWMNGRISAFQTMKVFLSFFLALGQFTHPLTLYKSP